MQPANTKEEVIYLGVLALGVVAAYLLQLGDALGAGWAPNPTGLGPIPRSPAT